MKARECCNRAVRLVEMREELIEALNHPVNWK
jgi:hypothetical protein